LRPASAQEVDREGQDEGESRKGPDLDNEIARWDSLLLGLGRDNQHLAHHRYEADEEERLDEDAAAEIHDPERVEQLRDDEDQQHSVEEKRARVDDRPGPGALGDVDRGAHHREPRGDHQQGGDDDVDRGLGASDPFLEIKDVADLYALAEAARKLAAQLLQG
jgi:hypothetical protein